jgi:hypothetical protein
VQLPSAVLAAMCSMHAPGSRERVRGHACAGGCGAGCGYIDVSTVDAGTAEHVSKARAKAAGACVLPKRLICFWVAVLRAALHACYVRPMALAHYTSKSPAPTTRRMPTAASWAAHGLHFG